MEVEMEKSRGKDQERGDKGCMSVESMFERSNPGRSALLHDARSVGL